MTFSWPSPSSLLKLPNNDDDGDDGDDDDDDDYNDDVMMIMIMMRMTMTMTMMVVMSCSNSTSYVLMESTSPHKMRFVTVCIFFSVTRDQQLWASLSSTEDLLFP